jgi:hypothetical protein
MTLFIYPRDIFDKRAVDEAFVKESRNVLLSGEHTIALLDDLALSDEAPRSASQNLATHSGAREAVYRGWMLTVKEYVRLEKTLLNHDITLKTSAKQYETAHHLPGWYADFEAITPKTYLWNPFGDESLDDFCSKLPKQAYLVKDYVKSRKHEWDTACFAPSVEALPAVIDEFVRLQTEENSFVGEVVVRKYEQFNKGAGEARVWWVDGEYVISLPHPDNPELLPAVDKDFLETVKASVKKLGCPFVVTDLAVQTTGEWRVIEVGDGQVSGLPRDFTGFSLWKAL